MKHASLAIRDKKGHKMRDVYVISKEVFRALEERGRTQKNINELINIYKTSGLLAFRDHNDHGYVAIRMDTDNVLQLCPVGQ